MQQLISCLRFLVTDYVIHVPPEKFSQGTVDLVNSQPRSVDKKGTRGARECCGARGHGGSQDTVENHRVF